jgi:hypothetical protein
MVKCKTILNIDDIELILEMIQEAKAHSKKYGWTLRQIHNVQNKLDEIVEDNIRDRKTMRNRKSRYGVK